MAQRQQTHPGRLAVSKIRDKDTNLENAGKRLSSSPAETHPFTRTVRLTIRATARFAKFLDENNENEIERELYCETSRFLCELKGLFKIGYQPPAELLTIMPELKKGIETLKAALTKHYRPDKTKRICAEIDRLINEVCDNAINATSTIHFSLRTFGCMSLIFCVHCHRVRYLSRMILLRRRTSHSTRHHMKPCPQIKNSQQRCARALRPAESHRLFHRLSHAKRHPLSKLGKRLSMP